MIKKSLLLYYTLLLIIQKLYSAESCYWQSTMCCFTPRDVSTDSMLELALVNYHRYHALEKSKISVYPKPFFIGAQRGQRKIAGLLFTGYLNATDSIWLGINTAAMVTKIHNSHAGGLDDIQFKLGFDGLRLEDSHATLYLVGTAPTGKKSYTCPLFHPYVGSKNGSLGLGINLDAVVTDLPDDSGFSWEFDLKYRHTFNPQFYYTPRNTLDLWTALNFPILQCSNLEFGYDFWWQQARARTISASQKIYIDIGYDYKHRDCYALLCALGAAYEFAPKNALTQWQVWITTGITF